MRRGAQPSGATILQMPASRNALFFSIFSTYSTNVMPLTSCSVGLKTGASGALAAMPARPAVGHTGAGAAAGWPPSGPSARGAGTGASCAGGARRVCCDLCCKLRRGWAAAGPLQRWEEATQPQWMACANNSVAQTQISGTQRGAKRVVGVDVS